MDNLNLALEKIKKQQAATTVGTVLCVGDQLAEMLQQAPPETVAAVLADLGTKGMGIDAAEKKIREFAQAHGGCCGPKDADAILRKFYGMPEAAAEPRRQENTGAAQPAGLGISLADFMGVD